MEERLAPFSEISAPAGLVSEAPLSPSALRAAFAALHDQWRPLLVLNLVGASLLALGLFVSVPVSLLVMTDVYRQLTTAPPSNSGGVPQHSL